MNAAISVEEAGRNLDDLVKDVMSTHDERILMRDGQPVVKIVPIIPARTLGEIAPLWKKFDDERTMSMEERNAFADDVEAVHNLHNKPVPYRWD
jgi:antitoxin (DNA-binding transcriptional repressor) of toxin-antitoxin stability system